VSNDNYTFLKFDIPQILDSLNALFINLTPSIVETISGGIVLYKFENTIWNEKLNENNIGLIGFENLTPLDTVFFLEQNVELSINIKPFIIDGGLHSFALGVIDSTDNVSFYSKENLILEGNFNSTVVDHNSGYATNHDFWPSISFQFQENLSLKNNKILPNVFALHQNYPNPFNPKTIIQYDLPIESNVKIIIYNILGNMTKSLINNKQDAGFKSIQWDATNNHGKKVSAGLYLYSIEAGNYRQTKKMILIK
ncbi:MAG: T9SS C-terminal target domain-containing protein, partial [Flavobacteriaceae bacterium TMED238]